MADIDVDDNVKKRYDEFIEHLTQYMTTPIKDFPSIKPQILNILKIHRPIKIGDYQYGISKTGKKKCQLIVHEFNQRSEVREYFKVGMNGWHCCECTRVGATDGINDLVILHGFVFVKLEHECQSRELSFVMKVQSFYKDGKLDEAAALQKSVLGSEDLNLISSKKVSVKRKTKPPKSTKNIDENASLHYATDAEVNEELQPSIMDEQMNEIQEIRPPEIVFAEIIENLEKYTSSKRDEILSNKSIILRVLKTHRPFKMKKRVREYCKDVSAKCAWLCNECRRMYYGNKIMKRQYLHSVNGILFISNNHDRKCQPRDYRLVMKYQKHLEKGDTTAARSMARSTNFTYGQNILNLNFIDEKLTLNNPLSTRKRINEYQSDDKSCVKPPAHKKSKCSESTLNDTVLDEKNYDLLKGDFTSCKKSKRKTATSDVLMDDTNINEIVEREQQNKYEIKTEKKIDAEIEVVSPDLHESEAVNQTEEEKPESISRNSIFAFEKPSTLMLEKFCAKLNIQYRNRAMKIWDQIMIEQIDTVSFQSTNIEVHEFQTENFYEILSKLFTGKSKHHQQIQETIVEAFRKKMVESGEMSARKFDKHYSKDTVTDRHLSFIANFLSCRILIFDGEEGELRKYGKWKETSRKRATLVLSFSDGIYSIVLNL